MIRREEFLEAVSRVREVVGEGDCLDCRHGGGSGSRRMASFLLIAACVNCLLQGAVVIKKLSLMSLA